MPIPLRCDWCLREETPKIRLPSNTIIVPKGWEFIPVVEAANPCEVIVSCGTACKRKLGDARAAIRDAHDGRRRLEEKKKRLV